LSLLNMAPAAARTVNPWVPGRDCDLHQIRALPDLGVAGVVVVDDLHGADLSRRMLEVVPLDDGVARGAPQQDDRSRAGGEPHRAVHVGQGRGLGAAGFSLDHVMQLDELDPFGQGELSGPVVRRADLVVGEPERGILEGVDDDGVRVGQVREPDQRLGMAGEIGRRWPLPHDEALSEHVPFVLVEVSPQRSGNLRRPIHREDEESARSRFNGVVEQRLCQPEPSSYELSVEGWSSRRLGGRR